MRYKTLFRLGLKLIGVWLVVTSIPKLLSNLFFALPTLRSGVFSEIDGVLEWIGFVLELLPAPVQAVLGRP